MFISKTFLDIEGTFNNATTHSFVKALARRGIEHTLCQWLKTSSENRIIISTVDEATLVANPVEGWLQKGILSPLLWADQIDERVDELVAKGFHCFGYAIGVKGKSEEVISKRMPIDVSTVNNWRNQERLSFNVMKTQVVTFIRKKSLRGLKPVRLAELQISTAKEVNPLKNSPGTSKRLLIKYYWPSAAAGKCLGKTGDSTQRTQSYRLCCGQT